MKEKLRLEKMWIALTLPFIFLLLVSSAYSANSDNSNIQAHVTILGPVNSMNYAIFFNGAGGNIVLANGFRLSKYTQQTNLLDGYFYQRMISSNQAYNWQVVNYNSRGYMTVDINIFPFLPRLFSMKVSESLTVVDNGSNKCFIVTQSMVSCQTSGYLLMNGAGLLAQNGQIPIKYLNYVFTPTSGQITGFDSNNNKILEIDNINIKSLKVST